MSDEDGGGGGAVPDEYMGEVGELRAALLVQDEEIRKLRAMVSGTASSSVESKYLEALRKNKELKLRLDSEKLRNSKMSAQIADLERLVHDATSVAPIPSRMARSQANVDTDEASVKDLKDKAERATRSTTELRRINDELKKDITKMKRLLQREVGDDVDIDKLLNNTNPSPGDASDATTQWRGRAQQISLLKTKVKNLEKKLSEVAAGQEMMAGMLSDTASVGTARTGLTTTTTTLLPGGGKDWEEMQKSHIENMEAKRRNENRELQAAIKLKEADIAALQKKFDASNARTTVLEREMGNLRMSLQRVLDKTENDDKLITAYKSELDQLRDDMRNIKSGGPQGAVELPKSSNPHDVVTLQAKLQKLQAEVIDAQRQLVDKAVAEGGVGDGPVDVDNCRHCRGTRIEASHLRQLVDSLQDRLVESVTFVPFDATQISEDMPVRQVIEKCSLLKAENASLRERLVLMESITQREVTVYKSMAESLRAELEQRDRNKIKM